MSTPGVEERHLGYEETRAVNSRYLDSNKVISEFMEWGEGGGEIERGRWVKNLSLSQCAKYLPLEASPFALIDWRQSPGILLKIEA